MYSIKDLETLSGIKAHTLRIWEQRYEFFSPERTDTGIRKYTYKDLQKTLNTSLLINRGSKISKIAPLSDTEINKATLESKADLNNYDSEINELIKNSLLYEEYKFDGILNSLTKKIGLKDTILKVVFPFLQKIGLLWSTSQIFPSNEHFATNLLKQKIFYEINKLKKPTSKTKCLLFLPASNFHELSLLVCHYLLKSRGIQSIYLGQDVPLNNTLLTIKQTSPDFVVTSIYNSTTLLEFEKYLIQISEKFDKSIYIGTSLIKDCTNVKSRTNLKFVNNFDFIDSVK